MDDIVGIMNNTSNTAVCPCCGRAVKIVNTKSWGRQLAKHGYNQQSARIADGCPGSFINAEDASEYVKVCAEANEAEIYTELIPYLKMARKNLQENQRNQRAKDWPKNGRVDHTIQRAWGLFRLRRRLR